MKAAILCVVCVVVLLSSCIQAAEERDQERFHLDNYLQNNQRAQVKRAEGKLWFHLDNLLKDQDKASLQAQAQTQDQAQDQAEADQSADESSGTDSDPDKSYVKEKSGGTTTVIANKNFMSIMEEPDYKPLSPEKAAEEARLEAQEEQAKTGDEEKRKRNAGALRDKAKSDEAAQKQKQQDAASAAAKQRAQEEVQKAQEGADKTNQRSVEMAQKQEQQKKSEQKGKSDKCRKIKTNPTADVGKFDFPVFRYSPDLSFSGPWTFDSRATITGDFNGDGKKDFARLGPGRIFFFISKGNNDYFNPWYDYPPGWDFTFNEDVWTTLQATDINGDGRTDILRTYGTYNHIMFPSSNNVDCWNKDKIIASNCMSITAFTYPSGWNFRGEWHWNHPYTVQGDFNGDGKSDFGRVGGNYMHLFISKGDGSFYSPIYPFPDGWGSGVDANAWLPSAIDISGDCRADIVRTHVSTIRSYISQGSDNDCWLKDGWIGRECFRTVQFEIPSFWRFEGGWMWNSRAFVRADFNNDGKVDFVRVGGTEMRFFISKGDGSFFTPTYNFPAGWNFGFDENVWTTLPPGDFNGDGKFDIIRTYFTYHHGLYVVGSDADCWFRNEVISASCIKISTFNYPYGWNFSGGWTWNSLASVVGDWNGDARDDFINLRGNTYNHQFIAI